MKVCVGITTRNRAEILPRAIQSVLDQDYPDIKISILDDASTDSTPSLSGRFPDIQWTRNSHPQGLIASRNQLMKRTTADVYISLDDDAWFTTGDEITRTVAYLNGHSQCAALAYDILSPSHPRKSDRQDPVPISMFIGCGHAIRLSVAQKLDYYHPLPGTYGGEERDFCWRLMDHGYDILKLPGTHVWHDQAWSDRNWGPLHRSGVCNQLTIELLRCPMPELLIFFPYRLLSQLRFSFSRRHLAGPGLRGIIDFIRLVPQILSQRSPVSHHTYQNKIRLHHQPAETPPS